MQIILTKFYLLLLIYLSYSENKDLVRKLFEESLAKKYIFSPISNEQQN